MAGPSATGTGRAKPAWRKAPPATAALDQVHRADEAGDEGGGGLAVDDVGGRDLLGAAVAHDDDAVGEREGLVLAVGDEEGGDLQPLLQVADLLAQALAQVLVEAGEGLVEEQDLRLEHQRAGERDALLLAAGELVGHPLAVALEADLLERGLDAARDLVARAGGGASGRRRGS